MQWLKQIKQWFSCGGKRKGNPQAIPKLLDERSLGRAMDEARFLSRNQVEIATPKPGELPIPRRADE